MDIGAHQEGQLRDQIGDELYDLLDEKIGGKNMDILGFINEHRVLWLLAGIIASLYWIGKTIKEILWGKEK